jgi:hypothetical protein
MAAPRLGGPKLSGKPAPHVPGPKLGGKLSPYVPRGAQYDYKPPSVFVRYKILTALFVILLVSLFGYWALVLRQPRVEGPTPAHPALTQPTPTQPAPQSDPVYVEPLAPK